MDVEKRMHKCTKYINVQIEYNDSEKPITEKNEYMSVKDNRVRQTHKCENKAHGCSEAKYINVQDA
jgi:hypothetical protein